MFSKLPSLSKIKNNRRWKFIGGFFVALFLLISIFYLSLLAIPFSFDPPELVRVSSGMTVSQVAQELKEKNIIKQEKLFSFLVSYWGQETGVIAGDYYFSNRQNLITVARRMTQGDFGVRLIRVTIPEGLSARQKSAILDDLLPDFDKEEFIRQGSQVEGYLFPDTYFISPFATVEEVIAKMRNNFDQQISDLMFDINRSGRTLDEIIIMASLLETEARTTESRRIISGLLWKRLDNGMRLQVDAVFPYFMGKNTFELTLADLRYDSPYNTYRYEGLPPTAIANPGLDSIKASLYPEESPFWYYLSDMKGEMHYAITHDDHVRNKNIYLR